MSWTAEARRNHLWSAVVEVAEASEEELMFVLPRLRDEDLVKIRSCAHRAYLMSDDAVQAASNSSPAPPTAPAGRAEAWTYSSPPKESAAKAQDAAAPAKAATLAFAKPLSKQATGPAEGVQSWFASGSIRDNGYLGAYDRFDGNLNGKFAEAEAGQKAADLQRGRHGAGATQGGRACAVYGTALVRGGCDRPANGVGPGSRFDDFDYTSHGVRPGPGRSKQFADSTVAAFYHGPVRQEQFGQQGRWPAHRFAYGAAVRWELFVATSRGHRQYGGADYSGRT
ncbi:unnamed protein product [Symbiodinium sp. CCMP2592]|nr:unnamed protein product [Symbiodinium sp. CCMP2592]